MSRYGPHYFDRDGRPISLEQWCELVGHVESGYKRVAFTRVGMHEVSTVWLGLDHSFGQHCAPLIFETMTFPDCGVCDRYSTEAAAREGHEAIVTLLRAVLPDDELRMSEPDAHA